MVLFDCASNYYFLLWLCEALLLLVNASCLSTMTSDVAMSHGNVTRLCIQIVSAITDCMVISRGYLVLFWLSHANGADEFEI